MAPRTGGDALHRANTEIAELRQTIMRILNSGRRMKGDLEASGSKGRMRRSDDEAFLAAHVSPEKTLAQLADLLRGKLSPEDTAAVGKLLDAWARDTAEVEARLQWWGDNFGRAHDKQY